MADADSRRLRSQSWFARRDKQGFYYRSWLKSLGLPDDVFDGRPVIGICNTWSELTPCNSSFREVAEHVKRGVFEAGGLPLEFPVLSLGETQMRPTAMLFRNLVSMDVEEALRANPLDGVVLLMGCDKTTPSLLMGAASVDLPTIGISAGPALSGNWRGQPLGSGTGVIAMSEMVRAGTLEQRQFEEAEACMQRSRGTCMTMGTASTMACLVEAMGVSLPENAAIPAADSRRLRLAHLSGRRIVDMVREDLRLSKVLTRRAFENAICTSAAIGGSTNAVIHLLALAGRIGVPLTLDDWDRIGSRLPCLVDLMPSGRFLMEDFFYAGGLPAVLREIAEHLSLDALTVNGKTLGDNIVDAACWNRDVIRPASTPVRDSAGVAVVRGNLAPDGAVIKPSAASAKLLQHRGRAVVFDGIEDFRSRIDDEALDIDESCIMVLRNCGPRGYPGMAEVGNLPLPSKLLRRGVTDMVRISDARMSGTAYGTVVLHVSPEAAAGGPLALVESGDFIELDLRARRLHLDVSMEELERRRERWRPAPLPARGWERLHVQHVQQAHLGADLDFLVGKSGDGVARDSH